MCNRDALPRWVLRPCIACCRATRLCRDHCMASGGEWECRGCRPQSDSPPQSMRRKQCRIETACLRRRFRIRLTDCGVSARRSMLSQERMFVVVAGGRLRSAQADGEAGEERGVLIGGTDGLFVGEVLDAQCCQFGQSTPPEANATRSRARSRTSTRRSPVRPATIEPERRL